jgi:photosystem II stability/assembly factor-like uncharacterized protein
MVRLAAFAAALFVLAGRVEGQWTKVADGVLGRITIESSGIVFSDGLLWSGRYDLFRSSDSGLTWQQNPLAVEAGLDRITDIQFLDRNNGLVTSYFGIHRTTDGGRTWQTIIDGNTINEAANACFLGSPNAIAVSDFGGGIWISSDGGANWTVQRLDTNLSQLLFRNGSLYALGAKLLDGGDWRGVMYRSTDRGTTWQFLPGSLPSDCYSFIFDSCGTKGYLTHEGYAANDGDTISEVLVTSDGGNNWTRSVFNFPQFFAGALAASPTAVYTTTTAGGIFRTSGGTNWSMIGGPNAQIDTRAVCALNDSIILVMDGGGSIWRTMNSGGVPLESPYVPPHLSSNSLFGTDTISVCSDVRQSVLIYPGSGLACAAPAITSIALTGADAPYFTIVSAPPIGPITFDSVAVVFHPDAGRDYTADLRFAFADGKVFDVTLIGHGNDSTLITIAADTLITKTIGEVTLPIVIHGGIPSAFDFRIVWDSSSLEYRGTFDGAGTRVDKKLGEDNHSATIHITPSGTLALDTLLYTHFRFYPGEQRCVPIRFDSAYFWPDTSFCGKITSITGIDGASTMICAIQNCANPFLSRFLRDRTIQFRIAPNPASSFVEITSSEPVSNASIQILNSLGEIERSVTADLDAAPLSFDLTGMTSGVKFVRIAVEGVTRSEPILLVR